MLIDDTPNLPRAYRGRIQRAELKSMRADIALSLSSARSLVFIVLAQAESSSVGILICGVALFKVTQADWSFSSLQSTYTRYGQATQSIVGLAKSATRAYAGWGDLQRCLRLQRAYLNQPP